ncbi:MAG: hypothetical protein H7Z77_04770 [Chitinophagaceae bacterium]|nr:hypothetical protein [Polaromonas sp.]
MTMIFFVVLNFIEDAPRFTLVTDAQNGDGLCTAFVPVFHQIPAASAMNNQRSQAIAGKASDSMLKGQNSDGFGNKDGQLTTRRPFLLCQEIIEPPKIVK